ncbi:MAG: outer membrane protein assembly factor BamB [Verrucomicrobiales bacterium]|jgi:outer membrane protein assembly factor BamB
MRHTAALNFVIRFHQSTKTASAPALNQVTHPNLRFLSDFSQAAPRHRGMMTDVNPLPLLILSIFLLPLAANADWPEFRGPTQNGHVAGDEALPIEWSESSGVAWKVAIPGKAWSTPVVSGGKVWLSNATDNGKTMSVVCIDAASGKILHNKVLFTNESPEPLGNPVNAYGSPSPAIEGERVYIHFGSYGTACLNTSSAEVIWERRDLPCRHYRGPGSSVVIYENLLLLTMDGVDVQYLTALDKETGKTVWKTDRSTDFDDLGPDGKPIAEGDLRKAYTTPLLVPDGDSSVIISTGAKATFGYDAATGKELWHVTYKGFSNAASPLYNDGMAIINTGYGKANLIAVPVDGKSRGDLTATIKWTATKRVPQRSSPVIVGPLLFMISDNGVVTCLNLTTGDAEWSERVKGSFSGSPIYQNGRIYFCSEQGETYVIAAKSDYELLRTNTLDDGMLASPAASDGDLYLRGKEHLYKISKGG